MKKTESTTFIGFIISTPLWTLFAAGLLFSLFISYGYRQGNSVSQMKPPGLPRAEAPPLKTLKQGEIRAPQVEKLRIYSGKVGERDTLFNILKAQGSSPKLVSQVVAAAKNLFDLNHIRVGSPYRLGFDGSGRLKMLEYEIDGQKLLRVEKSNGSFRAATSRIDYQTQEAAFSGVIKASLYNSVVGRGESPLLVIQMAKIFAWDIDFNTDLRKGDSFKLLVEKKYRNGKYVRDGRILAAEFINKGRPYRAIYFEDAGVLGDYYTEDGKSLRKQFLKAPLHYSHISSGYTLRRLHPILKRYMPHQGVDYAAPRGTPVVAIGDGKVIQARKKGWNGLFVKIKHNGTYTSSYGHLSRIGKGIKPGVWVKQGQVIGYVGSSGMATGPHLDFRIRRNGEYVNPLKLQIPPARNISRDEYDAFASVRDKMLAKFSTSRENRSAMRGDMITNSGK